MSAPRKESGSDAPQTLPRLNAGGRLFALRSEPRRASPLAGMGETQPDSVREERTRIDSWPEVRLEPSACPAENRTYGGREPAAASDGADAAGDRVGSARAADRAEGLSPRGTPAGRDRGSRGQAGGASAGATGGAGGGGSGRTLPAGGRDRLYGGKVGRASRAC